MTIKFDLTGTNRKALVKAISEITGAKAKYLFTPTYAYEIDYFTVTRDGALEFDDRADSEEIETLLESLDTRGFHAEPVSAPAEGTEQVDESETRPDVPTAACEAGNNCTANLLHEIQNTAQNAPVAPQAASNAHDASLGFTVSILLDKVNTDNLAALLDAKGALIQKALGIPATPIEITADSVSFPWFDTLPDADTASAYTAFISALCRISCERKRISARARVVENEKYAFRCFLLSLGFIGDEYKTARRILLKNLTGSSAFKNAAKKEAADSAISE